MSASPLSLTGTGLPAAPEIEREVLACLVMYCGQMVAALGDGLRPDDFYIQRHAVIFRAMVAEWERYEAFDSVTLTHAMRTAGTLDAAGGPGELDRLNDRAGTTAHLLHYVGILREKAVIRRYIVAAQNLEAAALEPDATVESVQRLAERSILDAGRRDTEATTVDGAAAAVEAMTRDALSMYLSTGVSALDGAIGGVPRNEPTIIAGRPGMGKSAFMLGMVGHGLVQEPARRQFVFSAEMPTRKITRLLIAKLACIPYRDLLMTLGDRDRSPVINDAVEAVSTAPVWFDDSAEPSVSDIVRRCMFMADKYGPPDLVYVDHWQNLNHPDVRDGRQHSAEAKGSKMLRRMAKEMGCGVVILSQLNKAADQRPPTQADVRECDQLVQDAGLILAPYRPSYRADAPPSDEPEHDARVLILKQRDGRTGSVGVQWQGRLQRYV